MTFRELVKAVRRECKIGVTEDHIREILLCAIRMIVEELMSDKAFASIDLIGFGKITFQRRQGHVYYDKNKFYDSWRVVFKQSDNLKKVVNDQMDITDLTVGNYYLYPNLHEAPSKFLLKRARPKTPPKNPLPKPEPIVFTNTMDSFKADARTRMLREKQRQKEAKEAKAKKRNYKQLIPDDEE